MRPSYFPPVQRELFAKLGVRALVWLPLVFDNALIGVVAVRMSEERGVGDEKLELAYALAQQVSVALELSRLAEQAKQAINGAGIGWATMNQMPKTRDKKNSYEQKT